MSPGNRRRLASAKCSFYRSTGALSITSKFKPPKDRVRCLPEAAHASVLIVDTFSAYRDQAAPNQVGNLLLSPSQSHQPMCANSTYSGTNTVVEKSCDPRGSLGDQCPQFATVQPYWEVNVKDIDRFDQNRDRPGFLGIFQESVVSPAHYLPASHVYAPNSGRKEVCAWK